MSLCGWSHIFHWTIQRHSFSLRFNHHRILIRLSVFLPHRGLWLPHFSQLHVLCQLLWQWSSTIFGNKYINYKQAHHTYGPTVISYWNNHTCQWNIWQTAPHRLLYSTYYSTNNVKLWKKIFLTKIFLPKLTKLSWN